jgi:hypothetical protein
MLLDNRSLFFVYRVAELVMYRLISKLCYKLHPIIYLIALLGLYLIALLILSQFDQIQSVSGFVEFGPLVKAAKGEKVPKNQLKNAIVKAIDALPK